MRRSMKSTRLAGAAALLALGLASAAQAQDDVSIGTGAVLRGLDKINGDTLDVTIPSGSAAMIGKLSVTMWECRYPQGDAAADAFAFMTITEPAKAPDPIFSGWMVGSSPAINALDHFRYDVWVLSCTTD
ncbi:DUF2155 domain-containing protein [Pseudooceanicola sp.]|uniref:DUF2155 domain-containing protein n=1 Tax=Pseudooceanicola sp. TaxID=1914328 RepID=UPI00405852B1